MILIGIGDMALVSAITGVSRLLTHTIPSISLSIVRIMVGTITNLDMGMEMV